MPLPPGTRLGPSQIVDSLGAGGMGEVYRARETKLDRDVAAPEQAKAKPVDRRADIWAFGCVLFEMLTGRRAFEGEDITDTIEKNPRQRLPHIGVARLELDDSRVTTREEVPPDGRFLMMSSTAGILPTTLTLTPELAAVALDFYRRAASLNNKPGWVRRLPRSEGHVRQ